MKRLRVRVQELSHHRGSGSQSGERSTAIGFSNVYILFKVFLNVIQWDFKEMAVLVDVERG